jgi:hypothetical protein
MALVSVVIGWATNGRPQFSPFRVRMMIEDKRSGGFASIHRGHC